MLADGNLSWRGNPLGALLLYEPASIKLILTPECSYYKTHLSAYNCRVCVLTQMCTKYD